MEGYKIRNGFLFNEKGVSIAVMIDEVTVEEEKIVESSFELVDAVKDFIKSIEGGKYKPKKTADNLKRILEKYEIELS